MKGWDDLREWIRRGLRKVDVAPSPIVKRVDTSYREW